MCGIDVAEYILTGHSRVHYIRYMVKDYTIGKIRKAYEYETQNKEI